MKIGLLGYGVVGSGVVKLIDEKYKKYKVTKIFDLPAKKKLIKERFVTNYLDIINDEDIDSVVETLGAGEFSYQLIKLSLLNKKNVITANKEVVSKHYEELLNIAFNNGVHFKFEASVLGAIPIIANLETVSQHANITSIWGIFNGTTNYILTKIFEENMSFASALLNAQKLGFAESDPSSDIEGLDSARKIAILSMISYGFKSDINNIKRVSLKKLSNEMINVLKENNLVLKYISSSTYDTRGLIIEVLPIAFKKDNPITKVNNANNFVNYYSGTTSNITMEGCGAGSLPTATAILNDLVSIDLLKIKKPKEMKPKESKINRSKFDYYVETSEKISLDIAEEITKNIFLFKNVNLCDIEKVIINAEIIIRVEK